jgi:hypothetical protein
VVEYLPSKNEALSSNPSTDKEGEKRSLLIKPCEHIEWLTALGELELRPWN